MFYNYLQKHDFFLEQYEYVFLLDDDILITVDAVNKLFEMMENYALKIAQPSLVNSYYTYDHTLNNPFTIIRYTNFVEMMMPCFQVDALKKVLFTFKESVRWRGIEWHWEKLVTSNHKDIAIIDEVKAIHTRPIQSSDIRYQLLAEKYLEENKLSRKIVDYGGICKLEGAIKKEGYLITDFEEYVKIKKLIDNEAGTLIYALQQIIKKGEIIPLALYFYMLANFTEKKKYKDFAINLLNKILTNVDVNKVDLLFFRELLTMQKNRNYRRSILEKICISLSLFSKLKRDCSLLPDCINIINNLNDRNYED